MTIPLDPAGLEAAAKAVYEAIPVALKDLVARERAEAATGIEHGSGVPDTWIARRAVRAYLAASPDERLREAHDLFRETLERIAECHDIDVNGEYVKRNQPVMSAYGANNIARDALAAADREENTDD